MRVWRNETLHRGKGRGGVYCPPRHCSPPPRILPRNVSLHRRATRVAYGVTGAQAVLYAGAACHPAPRSPLTRVIRARDPRRGVSGDAPMYRRRRIGVASSGAGMRDGRGSGYGQTGETPPAGGGGVPGTFSRARSSFMRRWRRRGRRSRGGAVCRGGVLGARMAGALIPSRRP